jgi:hypothetical protein
MTKPRLLTVKMLCASGGLMVGAIIFVLTKGIEEYNVAVAMIIYSVAQLAIFGGFVWYGFKKKLYTWR